VKDTSACKSLHLCNCLILNYVRFEAAWDGDLGTIKSLTLAPWGPSNEKPLFIAVEDKVPQTPFSIAVRRGHRQVARAILEIAYAQLELPDWRGPKRYGLREDVEEDMNGTNVFEELVDQKFTYDDISELSSAVKSSTKPTDLMSRKCDFWKFNEYMNGGKEYTYGVNQEKIERAGKHSLLTWAIITDDRDLFSFLLDLQIEWLGTPEDDSTPIPTFPKLDYSFALKYGRTDLLADMIKYGGAGLKLESLVKASGVKYKEKPKYYQGLSVSIE
jgi:hypothetical protein